MRARAKVRGLSIGAALVLAALVGAVAGDQRETAPSWLFARRSPSPAPATTRLAPPVALSVGQARVRGGRAAVYTVSSTADSGAGSLRAAITSANTSAGLDTIEFGIPGSAPFIITLASPLPAVTDGVIIDATSQPGYGSSPVVQLTGGGLAFTSGSGSVVRGLAIDGVVGVGVSVSGTASNVSVLSCWIGVAISGTSQGINGIGVSIQDNPGNAVGSLIAGEGDVIGNCSGGGVRIAGNASTNNMVLGSRIGLDANGAVAANLHGVYVATGLNLVAGNTISGNLQHGVYLDTGVAANNTVRANRIGTNAAGTAAVPNGGNGVNISGAHGTTIGGITAVEGNLISGNIGDGIAMTGAGATQNSVDCNFIGTNAAGTAGIANGRGIALTGGANLNLIGSYNAEVPNTIAYNTGAGIAVLGSSTIKNPFPNNSFRANGGLAIDLGGDGVTANDAGDADAGPNLLLNYPVLTSVSTDGTSLSVSGTLDSTVSASSYPHTVLLYSVGDTPDPSGHGEAAALLGQINVTAPGNFSGVVASALAAGSRVCAATVDHLANQSELGANVIVLGGGAGALHLGFVAQPASAVAGATLAPVSVEVLDINNQRVTTDTSSITLALTPGTTAALSGAVTVAAVNGLATFNALSISKSGTSYTIDANAAGVTGGTSSAFNITPGAPMAGNTQIYADKANAQADGTDQVTVTVVVHDSHNNPVPGVLASRVHVTGSPSSGLAVTQPTVATDAQGETTATVTRTVTGVVVFTVAFDGTSAPVSVNVAFTAVTVSASLSTIVADAATRAADGTDTATLTITVRDALGHAMAGVAAAQVVVAGTPTTGLTLTQPTTATNASGQTTATATCTRVGLVHFTATVIGVAFTTAADVTFQAGAPSASLSTLAVDRPSVTADGTDTATVTVTVRDAQGNAIAGVPAANVMLAAAPSTGLTLTQPTTATNASGQTTGTLKGTVVGTVTVSATVSGTAVTQTLQVGLVTAGIDAAGSGVAASATSVPADGTTPVTLTITVLDSGGSPLAGVAANRLRIVANPSSGVSLTQPTTATDAQGHTTASATCSTAGTVTFTATIDGGALGVTIAVNFAGAVPDAAHCSLAADKTSAGADGADTVTFTATVHDVNGNPLAGIGGSQMALAVDIASGVTLGAFGVTDAGGHATATATSTRSGARSFSLRLAGAAAGSPVAVTFTAGAVDAARSTLTADRGTAVANGQDSIVLTLTLRDAQGNAKAGVAAAAVAFTSTGGAGSGLTLTGPTAASDASGRMTLSAKSTVVQAVTLRVAVGAQAWTVSVSFQPSQPSASRSTVTLLPALIAADGVQQATLSVRLQDATGQPVVGSPASARSLVSSLVTVTVADAGADSDAHGAFEMRLTSRQAGTTQLTLTVGGVRLAPVTLTVAGYADLHLVAGLQFVGLPVTPLADSLAALLALPGVSARAFDPALQTYTEIGTAYTAGHGLWVQSAAALTQRLLGQATPDTAQRLPLTRGWNALANPFGQSVTWDLSAITVELGGVSLGSLVDPALWTSRVAPYGWLYEPGTGYRLLGDTTLPEFAAAQGTLPAYSGFWLHAETDGLTLVLPPPSAARAHRAQAAPTHSDWTLSLQAAQGEAGASQVIVGSSGRLAQSLVLALPPAARGQAPFGLTIVAAGGSRSAGEVRSAGPTQSWDLEVTSASTAPVVVSWPGLGRGLPRGLVLDLADGAGTTLLNTRAAWRWQPSRAGEVRRLRLTARLGHAARSAVTSLSLAAGRGGGQTVVLTLSAPAEVTLNVRGMGGRLVRAVHQSCGAGQAQLAWDGTDSQGRAVPPGSYRLEAEALADNGAVDRVTRTVTLTGR